MAGHSKWANIKHKKAATDAKRAKVWSKLSKAIMVAARAGGGELDTNARLRTIVNDAKAASMPRDNIERAIRKGCGELETDSFEEIIYEGYGAGGVAIMCDILTDNRNRTAPELRKVFEKYEGNLGASGCVAWMFDRKGLFLVNGSAAGSEERLMEVALAAGAEDIRSAGTDFEVICDPDSFSDVQQALRDSGIEVQSASVTRIPKNTVGLDAETAKKVMALVEALDDHDDVQQVSANFDLPESVMAQLEA
jgi:YebC/PmpR family DNA-binding regulatory protein